MRTGKRLWLFMLFCIAYSSGVMGQSIHFSQYYNAPHMVSPANTALLPDNDYRVGLNYRNQWSALPVPFNTFSAYGDMKIGGNKEKEHNNWLGLGFTFFSDKAGDGNLKLSQIQGNLAYHLQMSTKFLLSVGLSAASVQRSVNYDNLTFDAQWDGYEFNSHLANGEKVGVMHTSYTTFGAGINFSWFPNEAIYVKLGGGVANVNQPVESFYNGKNVVAMRPGATLDVTLRTGPVLIVNPSVYYTMQGGATEIVAGSLFRTVLSSNSSRMGSNMVQLILGGYYRVADAAIGVAGVQIGNIQFMASYDLTLSSLSPYNASYGALEFSLVYQGQYKKNEGIKRSISCPRFN